MLLVMDKSVDEENLTQPLETNHKEFKIAITFLTGYNGIFIVTDKKTKFYFIRSINDDDFSVFSNLRGAYELEGLNEEIKRIIIREDYFTEANYPFEIQTSFSILDSSIKISSQGSLIRLRPHDNLKNSLGFDATTLYE